MSSKLSSSHDLGGQRPVLANGTLPRVCGPTIRSVPAWVLLLGAAGCQQCEPRDPDPSPATATADPTAPADPADPRGVGPSPEEEVLRAGLEALRKESRVPPELELDRGTVRHARIDVAAPAAVGDDPDAVARWFLREHPQLLGIARPDDDLELTRRSPDGRHVFFRQLHAGIPIFPAELVVHTDGGRVIGFGGGYRTDFVDDGKPTLEPRQAESRAATHVGDPSARPTGETLLRYIDLRIAGVATATLHLVYRVPLPTAHVYVDARTGDVVHVESMLEHALDLDIETAHGHTSTSCWIMTSEDEQWFDEDGVVGGASPDAEGWQANTNARTVYQFFLDRFQRDSYDGDEEDIELYLDVGLSRFLSSQPNAHYDSGCDFFEYSDNMSTLDVMAHEYTHGVVATSAGLSDAPQPDALDESFGDIFAFAIDASNWRLGEGSPLGGIRDLTGGVRKHWSQFTATDSTGHGNSTIHTYTRYLLQLGQTKSDANSWPVKAIPAALIDSLYYRVLVGHLTGGATFMDARNAAVLVANELAAETGNKDIACSVRNAYAMVGLGTGDRDCDGTPDASDPNQDGDYRIDTEDNCPLVYNPMQYDQDGDGRGDACDDDVDGDGLSNPADNCPLVANPDQKDAIGGSPSGDVCDDGDGDGLMDAVDLCPRVASSDQRDTDGDRSGDVCDEDDDGDQLADGVDNCPLVANGDQSDSDRDEIGNACDLCADFTATDNTDTDGDGRANACDDDDDDDGALDVVDNCPIAPNPDQLDRDNDGEGMACDLDERLRWIQEHQKRTPVELEIKAGDRIPIPVCCIEGPVPRDRRLTIDLELARAARARVVDETGRVVARGGPPATVQRLRFLPAANAGAASAREAADRLRAPGTPRYFLEILEVQPDHTREVMLPRHPGVTATVRTGLQRE